MTKRTTRKPVEPEPTTAPPEPDGPQDHETEPGTEPPKPEPQTSPNRPGGRDTADVPDIPPDDPPW